MVEDAQRSDFDLIWHRYPERQIRASSVWWFFLLLPKQATGYGPKQAMFTLVSVAGDWFRINHHQHPGLGQPLTLNGGAESFNSAVQGWFFNGQHVHKDIVHQSATATLSPARSLRAWKAADNGTSYGGEIVASGDRPFGIEAKFTGARGHAHFEAWGTPGSEITRPANVHDYNTVLGGAQTIAWRRLWFAGEFGYPGKTEHLEGIGYFQRVCLNIYPFPWKWIWAAFEDDSVFSCFIPYLGPHLLRRGDRLFPDRMERATISLKQSNYFYRGPSGQSVEFDTVTVTPIQAAGWPQFLVECRSTNDDYLRFCAVPHGHMRNLLDRPVLRGLWHSRYNYNEFLFRTEGLEGQVGSQTLSARTLGEGYGNVEYTWGLGAH